MGVDYSELRGKLLSRIVRVGLFRALGGEALPDSFDFESPFRMVGATRRFRTSLKLVSNRSLPDSVELFQAAPMDPEEGAVYSEDLRFWLNEDIPDEKFRIP